LGCGDPILLVQDTEGTGSGSSDAGPTPVSVSTAATLDDSTGVGDATATADTGSTSIGPMDEVTTDPDPDTSGSGSSGDGEDTSTGEPACDPVGPGGLPGVNPGTIWIANSVESTISRVDTETLVETGRFLTRPDANGSPSRTSVGLDGDVAVANRSGGLTKFYGDLADCTDLDGDGVIETSSDSTPLAWDDEECRAWHIPMAYTSQRPVAWTSGTTSADGCSRDEERIWTAGVINNLVVEVVLVDGEAGVILDSVQLPEVVPNFYGLYGGAVDANNDFWASQLGVGDLVHVDVDDLSYETFPMPVSGYGITVGPSGYVFTCSTQVGRFDPVTQTWATAQVGGSGGCMEDDAGFLWMASQPVVAVDVNTLTVAATYPVPEYVHGVSVDFQGHVWGVGMQTTAYRLDPGSGALDTVTGFNGPYTYSDMTGFALASVSAP
jgi:hypothetical protein